MRVAFSGAHRTGKTSLIEELSRLLRGYASLDEPYHQMAEEGYEFRHPPSLEDFEAQLERSIECLADPDVNVLFDRCPLDILAYLQVHEDAASFALDEWMPRVGRAVETLDLIVFVPIEPEDRIRFSDEDDDGSRTAVDERLRALLLDDELGLGVEAIEVEGDLHERTRHVLREIGRRE